MDYVADHAVDPQLVDYVVFALGWIVIGCLIWSTDQAEQLAPTREARRAG